MPQQSSRSPYFTSHSDFGVRPSEPELEFKFATFALRAFTISSHPHATLLFYVIPFLTSRLLHQSLAS